MSARPLARAAVLLVAASAALCISTASASAEEEHPRESAPRSATAYEHMRIGENLGRSFK